MRALRFALSIMAVATAAALPAHADDLRIINNIYSARLGASL